ncbi:hypothetical protein AVEN_206165-1 [Araneus ventricosus]|uniref:Uncharacterized protein n=1 Tax=Araneus ventricosus TaxID=182803 RepID=A0A4Y2EDX6_ARAVE|nr:hypothetical protein AVEN_206165-1 [Araneus ventricosus]
MSCCRISRNYSPCGHTNGGAPSPSTSDSTYLLREESGRGLVMGYMDPCLSTRAVVMDYDGLVVRSWPRVRMFTGSDHDIQWPNARPAGVVRKVGERAPAQASSSSSNCGSKLRGPSLVLHRNRTSM